MAGAFPSTGARERDWRWRVGNHGLDREPDANDDATNRSPLNSSPQSYDCSSVRLRVPTARDSPATAGVVVYALPPP